jgi:hypothetical protein
MKPKLAELSTDMREHLEEVAKKLAAGEEVRSDSDPVIRALVTQKMVDETLWMTKNQQGWFCSSVTPAGLNHIDPRVAAIYMLGGR